MDHAESSNPFRRLMQIDVSKHVEHKGGFAYLSWPFAVAQLRQADPAAYWEIRRFDGLPYLFTDLGFFVEVAVTVQGVTLSQIHPVLDNRNRPIISPTSFDINTSIQRALVKAIALHGLGLNIYAGEDLPEFTGAGNDPTKPTKLHPEPAPMPTRPAPVPPRPARPRPTTEELASAAQVRYMERLVDEVGVDVHALLDYFGYDSLEQVPRSEVNRVIKAIESKRRAA